MINVNDKEYKVVVLIPAGRQRFASILTRYIENELETFKEIDECIWMHCTSNKTDSEWIYKNSESLPAFHKVYVDERCKSPKDANEMVWAIGCCQDVLGREKDTVYVRIDDDILFLSQHLIGNIARQCILNSLKGHLLTLPFILNNGRMNYMLANCRLISTGNQDAVFDLYQHQGNFHHVYDMQKNFIGGTLSSEKIMSIKSREISDTGGVNTNCVSWLGSQFTSLDESVNKRNMEENEITVKWVSRTNKSHVIDPSIGIACHYSFRRQSDFIEKTDLFDLYSRLCDKEMSSRKRV